MAQPNSTIVFPKKGVTVYLPGGVHGFDHVMAARLGGVPMHPNHAKDLAKHVMTAEEKKAADDAAKVEADKKAAEASSKAEADEKAADATAESATETEASPASAA